MIENFDWNIDLFYSLNSFAGQNSVIDLFFVFLGEWLIFIIIFVYFLFFAKQIWADKRIELYEFVLYFSASVGAWFIAKGIKMSFPTERPFFYLEDVNQLIIESQLSSFPSGHATLSFALAYSIFLYDKKIGSIFLVLALLVALGRVFTGVHFPLDIFIGSILGILVSLIFYKILYKLKK